MAAEVYYPLNDLNDYSGRGRHLTNSNCQLMVDKGPRKSCYFSAAIDGTYRLYTFNTQIIQANKTIRFWFKYDNSLIGGRYFLTFGTTSDLCLQVYSTTTTMRYFVYSPGAGTYVTKTVSQFFPTSGYNKWHCCHQVYDFTNQNVKTFINGQLYNTWDFTGTDYTHVVTSRRIYLFTYTTSLQQKMSLAEVLIDNTIWSAAQVKNDFMLIKGMLGGLQ